MRSTRLTPAFDLSRKLLAALILLSPTVWFAGCDGGGQAYFMSRGATAARTGSSPPASQPAAQLNSLAVGPPDTGVAMGSSVQFTATALYSDGTKRDVSSQVAWSSSDPKVASISNMAGSVGLATGRGIGSTTITATQGNISASTTVTVTAATLVSIGITPANPSVASGTVAALKATGVYTDNSVLDLTSSVAWSSSGPGIASISNDSDSNGQVTGLIPGTVLITAGFQGISASSTLVVTAATVVSIEVTPANPTLAKGTTQPLTATAVYSDKSTQDVTRQAIWMSSIPAVASVSNNLGSVGRAIALSTGSTTAIAFFGGASGSAVVTVTAAQLVSIGITPVNQTLAKGLSSSLTAIGTYTDNSTQNLTTAATWTSSDATVAAVSNASGYDGLVTTLSPGSVTISAGSGGISGSTALTVTAATPVSISVSPPSSAIANGSNEQFTATAVYTDNSTQNISAAVTWASSTPAIASISNAAGSHGLATSASVGSTTISATLGTLSGSTPLTVTAATLVSIAITPTNPTIANGTSQQFAATALYTDNSTQDITNAVTWGSSNAPTASISNASGSQGLATSAATGLTTITATAGNLAGSTSLTVTPATLVSITITPVSPNIANGTSQQFNATGLYTDNSTQNLTAAATWNASDTTVASISNAAGSYGLATSAAPGTTAITAVLNGVTSPAATLTVTASSTYVYAVNQGDNSLSQYTISTGGVLSLVAAAAPTGNDPATVTIDPSGRYVYVTNQNADTIWEYTIGSGGALTFSVSVSTGTTPDAFAIDPSGHYGYVLNFDDSTISQYTVGAGGALTSLPGVAPSTGADPYSINVDPLDRYVYVLNSADGTISEYKIGTGGALTGIGTKNTGTFPDGLAIDPTGRYVYVANFVSNSLSQYTIGTGGALALIGTIQLGAGTNPAAVIVDPTGHYVYVANYGTNTVSQYSIGTGGVLTSIAAPVPTGLAPYSIAVDPSGRYAYVANQGDSTASQYAIGVGGALTEIPPPPATGNYPVCITAGY